jgi:hypothetical protein
MSTDQTPPDPTENLLRSYFAEQDRVSSRSQETSKALFGLRRVDEELAALVETALVSRGPGEETLRFVAGGLTILVSVGAGRCDVSVAPIPDRVEVEVGGERRAVALDAAGGATVSVDGVVRLRISAGDRTVLTDAFRVPPG